MCVGLHLSRCARLMIAVLVVLAVVQFVNAQPQQRADIPTKSLALALSTSDLTTEIATMLRAYYDGWTKLDAAAVSAAVAADGFVTVDGRVLTSSVFKSSVRADLRQTTITNSKLRSCASFSPIPTMQLPITV